MSSETTNIAVLVETTPALVFSDPKKADELFVHIEQEIATSDPDLTSEKGRKAIASLAYKISRTKTAIDDAGSSLIEEANKTVRSVNAERKRLRDHLDGLRDKARKPLSDWEAEQERRKRQRQQIVDDLKSAGHVSIDDTAETLRARIREVQNTELHLDFLADFFDLAKDAQSSSLSTLNAALGRQVQLDEERAELERLREESQRREEEERVEREARQAQERQARYVDDQIKHIIDCGRGRIGGKPYPLAVLQRELDEKVNIDDTFGDRKREAEEALETARRALSEVAARQQQEAEAEEARRRETAEADARRREEEAAQRARDEASAEQQRAQKEAEARAADQEHRQEVLTAAQTAIKSAAGISDGTAKKIVLAIAAGNVPHISIRF